MANINSDIKRAKSVVPDYPELPDAPPAAAYAPVEMDKPAPFETRSAAPDVGDITWDDPKHKTFPEDAIIFPVYNTETERIRDERNGRYRRVEETTARTNFLCIEMSKITQTKTGGIESKPVAETLPFGSRVSHFKRLRGAGFTIPEIIMHIAAMPKCGIDFWMAPVEAALIESEKVALKHKLSKMGLDQAKRDSQKAVVQTNNTVFGNPELVEA